MRNARRTAHSRTLALLALLLALTGCAAGSTTSTINQTPRATPTATPAALDPALGSLTLYVASHVASASGELTAFNAQTGAVRWHVRTAAMYGTPAVAAGTVYVAPQDGSVQALRARDGTPLWSFTRNAQVDGYPTVAGGVVYVSADEGAVYALNAATGKLIWRFNAPNNNDHIYAATAVAGGEVFVSSGGSDDNFYTLDAATGSVRWQVHAAGGFDGVPLAANGVVYAGANDNALYAMRASDGAVLWRLMTQGHIIAQPAIAGGTIYVGSTDDTLYAADLKTGKPLWHFATSGTSASTTAGSLATGVAPSVASTNGSIVYASSQAGIIYALDAATGTPRWQVSGQYNISPAPAIANGALFVADDGGTVRGLRASDGAASWMATVDGADFAQPVVA